eukprot:1145586-Pelagomonas_calceolata.AAC.5
MTQMCAAHRILDGHAKWLHNMQGLAVMQVVTHMRASYSAHGNMPHYSARCSCRSCSNYANIHATLLCTMLMQELQ